MKKITKCLYPYFAPFSSEDYQTHPRRPTAIRTVRSVLCREIANEPIVPQVRLEKKSNSQYLITQSINYCVYDVLPFNNRRTSVVKRITKLFFTLFE